MLVAGEHEGATDYSVVIGAPLHANVTGDSAYVVAPATMTFNPTRQADYLQSGAIFTVALRKQEDSWLLPLGQRAKGTRPCRDRPSLCSGVHVAAANFSKCSSRMKFDPRHPGVRPHDAREPQLPPRAGQWADMVQGGGALE